MRKLKIYLLSVFAGIVVVSCTDHTVEPINPLGPIDKAYMLKYLEYENFVLDISTGTNNVTRDTINVFPYTSEVFNRLYPVYSDLTGFAFSIEPTTIIRGPILKARRNSLSNAPSALAHDTIYVNLMLETLQEMIVMNEDQSVNGKNQFLVDYAKKEKLNMNGLLGKVMRIDSLQRL